MPLASCHGNLYCVLESMETRHLTETVMTASVRTTQTLLLAAFVLGCAPAALASSLEQSTGAAPVVVAQSQVSAPTLSPPPALDAIAYPSYQAGVRHAAAQGNEALRRYIWRTRMIYNFYFDDFAKKD